MTKKYNKDFIKTFAEVETLCCHKFGVENGGIAYYYDKIEKARFAPDRQDTMDRLSKYIEVNAYLEKKSSNKTALEKDDIKWLKDFAKKLEKKKDPMSEYLRKARNYARSRKTRRVLLVLFIIALVGAAVAAGIFLF